MTAQGVPFSALACVASALMLAACQQASLPGTTTGELATSAITTQNFIPGVPKGYECPLVPNGFDPVGSIYRIDKSGTYFRVGNPSKDAAFAGHGSLKSDVQISNYVLSDTQKSNAGLSFQLLKNALPGLTASSTADFKRDITVNITVQDMVGEVIDDMAADRIVEWFRINIQPKRGSRYFLVRETVKAGAVSYSLKHEDLAKLGGEAQIESLANGKADVTVRDNDGLFEIKQTFSPDRIAVCSKSAEIAIEGDNGEPDKVVLRPAGETALPTIKSKNMDAKS